MKMIGGYEGADRPFVTGDRFQWWAFMNTIMKHWVPKKAGNFLTS
jgi:hypothetical protein